jgi:YggT family protein
MEGLIRLVMGLLAMLTGIYSLLIIIRIILTWFSNAHYGRPVQILSAITDPYLDWWRQKLNLRAGALDLSPIVAMAALSIAQTIFSTMASQGRISLGIILAVCLSALWSAASFILGFCLIVLVLRFIAYMCNSNMYSTFWRIIDSISQPLLYRINRMIFGKRLVRFTTGLITSIVALAAVWAVGGLIVRLLAGLLLRLAV